MKRLPAAVKRYIDAAHVCRIATARPDGAPHVIPVCPVFDGDRTLYVDLGPDSVTARGLRANPRVAVLIDEYDDDWTRLRKVLLHCAARPVKGAERTAAWKRIRTKYPQYTTVNWRPRLTVALRIERWMQEGVVGTRR
jgi:nitroimidazol reductase NimA-like FMN-containing flavoprotein (pyridoxamine 5'-phosphate oxidase superfamily)